MAEALVEYDYVAQESDEISIKKGDIIREILVKPGGWWEGSLNDKRGMFPDNFVRLIDKDNEVTFRSRKDAQRIRQCRVVYSYTPAHDDELQLKVGDVIDIVGEEEEGWWRGKLGEKQGVFPSNFVEEIKGDVTLKKIHKDENNGLAGETDSTTPSLPPKPTKSFCQANFNYSTTIPDELSFKEGDIICIISKDGQDPGWWRGELKGRVGVFPDNFVTLLSTSSDQAHHQHNETLSKDDKKIKAFAGAKQAVPTPTAVIKPNTVAQQRKSLELRAEEKTSPPVPGKKPSLPIKKSPSGSGGGGGLFSGIKKRLIDVTDGGIGSKNTNVAPILVRHEQMDPENAFDQVERSAMLSDPRANRAKAPGRRPPSMVFREGEPGIVNGNSEHVAVMDSLNESLNNNETEEIERKPRLREWEKHKAPWVEELKQNQAKRTSTSPGPPDRHKSTERLNEKECTTTTTTTTANNDNMSKSMSAIGRLKTPPHETTTTNELSNVVLRSKNPAPATPTRPHTLQNVSATSDTVTPKSLTPSPKPLTVCNDLKSNAGDSVKAASAVVDSSVPHKQYLELLDKISNLELRMEQHIQVHNATVEELKAKLQLETEMRMLLQAELERVTQCVKV